MKLRKKNIILTGIMIGCTTMSLTGCFGFGGEKEVTKELSDYDVVSSDTSENVTANTHVNMDVKPEDKPKQETDKISITYENQEHFNDTYTLVTLNVKNKSDDFMELNIDDFSGIMKDSDKSIKPKLIEGYSYIKAGEEGYLYLTFDTGGKDIQEISCYDLNLKF